MDPIVFSGQYGYICKEGLGTMIREDETAETIYGNGCHDEKTAEATPGRTGYGLEIF